MEWGRAVVGGKKRACFTWKPLSLNVSKILPKERSWSITNIWHKFIIKMLEHKQGCITFFVGDGVLQKWQRSYHYLCFCPRTFLTHHPPSPLFFEQITHGYSISKGVFLIHNIKSYGNIKNFKTKKANKVAEIYDLIWGQIYPHLVYWSGDRSQLFWLRTFKFASTILQYTWHFISTILPP